jgi:hypothetical protein
MISNYQCTYCGTPLYKTPSEEAQSKYKKFFCSNFCKNIYRGVNPMLSVPQNNPIFSAVISVYNMNRQPEYLTQITIHNTAKYIKQLGEIFVVANARVNGTPNISKTPKDMINIRKCFDSIKMTDVLVLPDIEKNWKSIKLKYWNPKDITYEIKD